MAHTADALIVGGGPAGLTTALTLARQAQSTIVFDDDDYRNKGSSSLHMVLTQDSVSPAEFRQKARENILAHYNKFVNFESVTVTHVKKTDGGFEAQNAAGQRWHGKKLILASGVENIYPTIDGYDECWAKGM